MMSRRRFTGMLAVLAGIPFLGGWSSRRRGKPQTDRELKGMGYIVTVDSFKTLREGHAVGLTDAGNLIITEGFNTAGSHSGFGGGTNMSFPRWVRVTYRGPFDRKEVGAREFWWDKGEVLAEHHVEVLSRIPEEVFEFAFAPRDPKLGRAIRLKFRLTDDRVLFGWDVQQMDFRTRNGGIKYALMGGDFLDNWGGRPYRPNSLIDMTKE